MIFPANYIQGDLYNDTKTGNISVYQRNFTFGILTFSAIDISALNDNATKVEAYFAMESQGAVAHAMEQWVKSDFKGCRYPE